MIVLPSLLNEPLASARWPRNATEAMAQDLKSRVSSERVRRLAPDEGMIYLFPQSFLAVRERTKSEPFWNWPMAAPQGIDFDLAVDIADFGIGSDAPILLDYRVNPLEPQVIRLQWLGSGKDNKWVEMAPD